MACGVPKGHHSFESPQGAREVPNRTPPQIFALQNFSVRAWLKESRGGLQTKSVLMPLERILHPKKRGQTQNSARQGVKTKPDLTYPSKTRGGLQTKVVKLIKVVETSGVIFWKKTNKLRLVKTRMTVKRSFFNSVNEKLRFGSRIMQRVTVSFWR